MPLLDDLRGLGLNKTEASAYLYLLENGASTPAQIAKGTGMLRTNTYHVIQSLLAQNLIQTTPSGKRLAYIARDPESLYQSIETKKQAISRILPDLRGLYTTQKHKPKIQFYDGLEQLTQAYWRSLEAKEVFAIGSTNTLEAVLPDLYHRYVSEVKDRQIFFRDLLTHPSHAKTGPYMKSILKGMYELKYLPKKHGDIPTDLLIWNDTIAHITLEEPYFATVITSPLLAKTMRTLFWIVWETLPAS